MKPRRLANLYIRHLEYLFSPPGLPLVSKSGPAGIPTTTVLVRGEAGAGKTTLATAVAYAIARDRKGVLLVLTTETSPVEVDVKVKFLRIPGKHVLSWEQRQSARKGSILVQHIALARSPDADPDGDAPPNILDTLWGLLQAYNEAEHAVPIVAVLIDGVLLADADAGPLVSRTDTAAFLQALESRGISTVIVEEKPPKATSWWPFVTDIVFELGFDTDPETKKLVRQLVCRKSRYTPAFAGPHEYDQDEDSILAVWPDPLDLDPSDLRKVRGKDATDPVLFWPLEDEGKCWVYRGGGLVCATISRQWDIVMAMDEPPSTSTLNIDPSDSNTHGNTSQGSLTPHPRAGAHAFAWQILRASRDYAYNAITIHTIDFLLSRIQSSATFSRLLRALLRSGFLIGIRGNEAEVGKLYPFANLTPDTWDMSGVRNLPKRSILGLERWLLSTATHPDALHHLSSWPTIQTIVSQGIASKISAADVQKILSFIPTLSGDDADEDAKYLSANAQCVAWIGRVTGQIPPTSYSAFDIDTYKAETGTQLALMWHAHGDPWRAARAFIPCDGLHHNTDNIIWAGLCGLFAEDKEAGKRLAEELEGTTVNTTLIVSFLAHIRVKQGDFADAKALILRATQASPAWYAERWYAEVLLTSADKSHHSVAAETLHELAKSKTTPAIHRAEMFYNLAIHAEHRRDKIEALAACKQALALNPHLVGLCTQLTARIQALP